MTTPDTTPEAVATAIRDLEEVAFRAEGRADDRTEDAADAGATMIRTLAAERDDVVKSVAILRADLVAETEAGDRWRKEIAALAAERDAALARAERAEAALAARTAAETTAALAADAVARARLAADRAAIAPTERDRREASGEHDPWAPWREGAGRS